MNKPEARRIYFRFSTMIFAPVLLVLAVSSGAWAQQAGSGEKTRPPSKVDPAVAIVGTHAIRESDVQRAMRSLSLGDQIDVRSRRARFIDSLVREELLFQTALEQARRDRESRDRIKSAVVGDMIENGIRSKVIVTDKQARSYYDSTRTNLGGEHIYLRDIQFADHAACRSQLDAIGNLDAFSEAARKYHVIKDLAREAGDVGTVMTRHVGFGYGDKLTGLEENKAHLLIHEGKCHIVWITDREILPVPPFEELRERLIAGLRSGAESELLQKVIADAKLRIAVTLLTGSGAEADGTKGVVDALRPQAEAPAAASDNGNSNQEPPPLQSALANKPDTVVKEPGSWRLTDQHGAFVSNTSLKGRPAIMSFGFTYCPEICPTTLLQMSEWITELGNKSDQALWSFVSVDPERDTPEVLKSYVENFSDKISGLTGPVEQLASLVARYDIVVRRTDTEDGDYTMDHSSSVLLLDADGKIFDTIRYGSDSSLAVEKITRLIDAHSVRKLN